MSRYGILLNFQKKAAVSARPALEATLRAADPAALLELATTRLELASAASLMGSQELLILVLLNEFAERDEQLQRSNEQPLYPTEELLWDEHQLPPSRVAANVLTTVCDSPHIPLVF